MKTRFNVTRKALWLLLPVLLMAFSGCGSGGSGSSLALSGKVIDGPVSGAQITIYQVTSSGLVQAGTGYTQSDGSFALTISPYVSSDYYLLYVYGGTFTNNGASTTAPTMVGFLVPGGTPTVYITPLTTLIGEALFNPDGTINTSLNSSQVDFYLEQMLYYIGQLFNGMSGSSLNSLSSSNPAQSQLITELLTLLQDLANTVAGQTGEKYGQAMQDLLNYLSFPNNGGGQALLAALTANGGNGNFTFNNFPFSGNGGGSANISFILNSTDQSGLSNAESFIPSSSGVSNIPASFSVPPVSMWILSGARVGNGTVRKIDSSGNLSGPYTVGPHPDSLAVDSNGNVWVAGSGTVTELSPAGASEQTCYLLTGSTASGPNYNDLNYVAVDYSNNVWVTSSDGYNYTPVVEKTPVTIYPGWGDGEGGYWEPGTSNIVNWWDGAIIKLNTASCGAGSPYITYFDTYSGSGSSLSSPGPIAVDKSGNLWVVALGGGFPNYGQWFSVNTAEFSSSTGNLIPLPSGVPDPGLQNFNSLAADPAGNIWAYAGLSAPANYTGTPNLSEIEPGGPVSNYTVQSSGSLNNDALVPYNGSPVAVDPSGNIWIVSTPYAYSPTISSSTVYEYAPNGSLKNKYILGVTVPGFFVSQAPGQIAFDPSGNAWVIGKNSSGAEGVIVINPQSAGGQQAFFQVPDPIAITSGSYSLTPPTVSSVSPANNATGVSTSSSVTATFSEAMNPSTINSSTFTLTGPNGTQVAGTVIYNATANTATFTPSFPLSTGTSYTATVTTGAYGANNLAFKSAYSWSFTTTAPASGGTNTFTIGTRPVGIAIDASGNIWVANSGDGTVEELNSSGSVIGTFTSNISGPGYIAIDASGNVWVTGNNTFITELLKSSGYTTSSTFNMAAPDMAGPARIAIDASGNVWTANTYSGSTSLYEFLAPNYTTSNTFSAGIPGGGIMTGLAIDGYGNVWSGSNNYGYGEVTELLSSSAYGSSNTFLTNMTGPDDIAIDSTGNAWVTNLAAANQLTSPGTVVKLTAPSTYSALYTVGNGPEGVAIDHSGNIWVANNGSNTVEELDQSGNIVKTYSVGTNPTDIAIDASGDVWVTNYGDGTVSELVGVATGPQFFPYSGPQFP